MRTIRWAAILALSLLPLTTRAADAPAAADTPAAPAAPSVPVAEPSARESLEKAQEHILKAMEALGQAGRQTLEEQGPPLRDKAREGLGAARQMLQELQRRLDPPPAATPSPPTPAQPAPKGEERLI
ncbi:MAG: hypothetical protein HQL82_09725 [Magnetococcales bacterium]|nr:hypothetical protein [Magnetococcales bacterium]